MNKIVLSIAIIACVLLSGCSTILSEKADLNKTSNGIRIFPPKIYFFVNNEQKTTYIYILPDSTNAYDVKPLTILAKQELTLEINEGMISKLTANQDTTAFIELIKLAATKDAKQSSAPAAGALTQNSIGGTFGLPDGIYVLSERGALSKIQ